MKVAHVAANLGGLEGKKKKKLRSPAFLRKYFNLFFCSSIALYISVSWVLKFSPTGFKMSSIDKYKLP